MTIDSSILTLLPKCRLGLLAAEVSVLQSTPELDKRIQNVLGEQRAELQTIKEIEFPVIQSTRQAYKLCGKEPSRYRPSAEALLRRIRTEKGLYRINNVVDVINLLSIETRYSIGGFNSANIQGNVSLTIGNSTPYEAIGRGNINIEFMPGLKDEIGFFGTPTSDSTRTMVTPDIKTLLLVFYDFMSDISLKNALNLASLYIREYCTGLNIKTHIIEEN